MRRFLPLAAVLTLLACHREPHEAPAGQSAGNPANDGIKGVHRDNKGKPAPAAAFESPDGKQVQLRQFTGKPVLVNLWATWCAPCVKELPTLDSIAKNGSISVIAISQDTAPPASVVAFLKAHQISTLKPYQDPKMNLSAALGPDTVLPTSILLDAQGKEVWRYVGDLDWRSPEATKLLSEGDAPSLRKG